MCGIAGFVDPLLSEDEGKRSVAAMAQCIAHRGPDDSSVFSENACYLGHNRLSIIDLSTEANQPMLYDDFVIVFNGEIYNYIEVKEKLIKLGALFTTQSDTEVILVAYKFWGADCVKEFVGMWAFVIWDRRKNLLFASRDRFGIKPFYYIQVGNRFYFASEYKPLKKSPLFSNDINLQQVSRGLQLGWVCYNDETYFNKIKALPAASNLVFDNGRVAIERYWDIETGNYSNHSFEEKKEKFFNLFADSIKLHLRSDVTVGSCLSGGLDSSAIVSMVQQLHPGIHYKSFSIYYEGKGDVDERPFIYEVIKKYPEIDPYYFSPSDDDVKESFHNALYHADVPCTGSSFISQYFLMKLISEHKVKVVLDGQGSDEYLGGYMHTFYRIVADHLRSGNIYKATTLTSAANRQMGAGVSGAFKHFAKSLLATANSEQSLYGIEYRNYWPFLSRIPKADIPFDLPAVKGSRTDNFLYNLIFNTSLPSLLHYEDRNSMAFSIESRVPFLDHRLVEFAFTLSSDDKVKGTETKHILRKALHGILPKAVEERKDKKGFVTPGESKWLRGPLAHLTEIDGNDLALLDSSKVLNLVNDYRKGNNTNASLIWRLATLNYWLKNFV